MSSDGIDLVVTDLDGTLWDPDMELHPSTFDALAELERRHVPVLVATGRRRRSALTGQRHNGLCLPSVLLNGSLGVDLRTGECFHRSAFAPEAATAVLDIYAEHQVGPCAYTALEAPDVLVGERVSTHPKHQASLRDHWESTDLHAAAQTVPLLGFSTLGHSTRAEVEPLAASLRARSDATVVVAYDAGFSGWSLMAQPPSISKWNGIEAYCAREGIDSRRVLALGDAENDLEMLTNAAVGVAMGGASAEVQRAADEVTDRIEDGGWAAAISRLV